MSRGYAAPDPYEYNGQLRECTKCGRHQPLAAPHWGRDASRKRVSWDSWCRKCVDEAPSRRSYEYNGQLRECTKCGRHQPLAAPHWGRDASRKWCRKCVDEAPSRRST